MDLLKSLLPQILAIVVPLVVIPLVLRFLPFILPTTGHLFDWVKAKADSVKNEYAHGLLVRLTQLVEATVLHFEQTRVEEIKAMLADGQITKEELAAEFETVKADAIAHVKELMDGQGLWQKAMYVFGNQEGELSKWIETQLEAAVAQLPESGTKDIVPPAPPAQG